MVRVAVRSFAQRLGRLFVLTHGTISNLACFAGAELHCSEAIKSLEKHMWKATLAGAMALVAMGSLSVSPDGLGMTRAAAQDIVVTEAHIARLKNALNLTPAQERHWGPLEARLRALANRQAAGDEADAGIVQRARARLANWTLNAAAVRQLSAAAQPVISTLDEGQKRRV
jgi:LTXXQ motif family protein